MEDLLLIGDLARRAEVSVQTLRHYDRLGLLKPSHVRSSGYRLYSEEDATRLELIRALRAAQFDLDTIGKLLAGTSSLADAISLQLRVLELQERAIGRQRVVLEAVMQTSQPEELPSRLKRLQALSKLDSMERGAFLSSQLSMYGGTGDQAIWQAATQDFPSELSEKQLDAWLELAELVTDPEFQTTLQRQLTGLPGIPPEQLEESKTALQQLFLFGRQAAGSGWPAAVKESWPNLDRLLQPLARLSNRSLNQEFLRVLMEYIAAGTSPLIDRYWQLVAELKGWAHDPSYQRGVQWILDALEARRNEFP